MNFSSIEDVVRGHLSFKSTSSRGWNTLFCEVCGDGSRSKGPRGGWLFDGDTASYNCFNCGISGNFDPRREYPFSQNMYTIFNSFSIPLKHCYFLITKYSGKQYKKPDVPKLSFEFIDTPDHFYELRNASPNDKVAYNATKHLIEERCIDPADYPFYLSTGNTQSNVAENITMAHAMRNRLIIPAYVNGKLIGFEGMALANQKSKYITYGPDLIHGYDNIFNKDDTVPLFISEGFFDSYHFKGVALTTNKINPKQIELLNRTDRPKIGLTDRFNTHHTLANKFIDLEWGLAFPNIKPYKDVSEAISHYGTIVVASSAMKNIKYGNIAKISLKLFNL